MENHVIGTDPYNIASITNIITNSTSNIVLLRNWKEFGRQLCINDADILELDTKVLIGQIQFKDISHELLTRWKANQGSRATLRWLYDALVTTGVKDIADQLAPQGCGPGNHLLAAKFKDEVRPQKDPDYYVTRTVSYRSKLDDKIFSDKSMKDHVFLVKGVSMYELRKIAGPDEQTETSGNQLHRKDNQISPRFILLEADTDYENISAKSKKPVHQVQKKADGDYFWIKSSKVDKVRKFLVKETALIPEENLTNIWDEIPRPRVISIDDSPGMGKTFLLNKLANEVKMNNPTTTTLFVLLQEFARQLNGSTGSPEAALKELAKYVSLDHNTAQTLEVLRSKENQFDLFFDGYDEVEQSKLRKVNNFLSSIRACKNVNLYVTTRPHLSNKLAQVISSRSYEILPFDEEKQIEFLTKYWNDKYKAIAGSKLIKFAQACLSALQVTMTNNEKDIAGIPLQCMMLAEVYSEEAVRASQSEGNIEFTPKVNSIFDMYSILVQQKFKRIAKYENVIENGLPKFKNLRKMYYQHHIYDALKLLFPDWLERLENLFKKRADAEVKEDLIYSIGLIEKSPYRTFSRFIHRTFAEYMLAEFLVESLTTSESIMELVFNTILGSVTEENKDQSDGPVYYKFKFPNMAYFINHHLDNYKQFQSIDWKIISRYLLSERPKTEQKQNICRVLIACVCSGLEDCFELIENVFANLLQTSGIVTLDKYFQFLPHLTIHHTKSLSFLKKVENFMQITLKMNMELCVYEPCLQKPKNMKDEKFFVKSIDLYKYPWISHCTPIHVAVFHGCFHIAEYLLWQYREHTGGKYFLHVCAHDSAENGVDVINNKLSIVDLLLDTNGNWLHEKFDESESTPLLQRNVHLKILEKLVARGADINYSSSHYGNVLQRSMPKKLCDYNDIMSWAFSSGYNDTNLTYRQAYYPFIYNIVKKYKILTSGTLDVLAKAGLDINAEKADGTTLLFYLLQRKLCTPDIISELLKSGANINHVNKEGENAMHIYASVAENELHSPKHAIEIIKLLGTRGPKLITEYDNKDNATPLLKYLQGDTIIKRRVNLQLLGTFYELGADFNAKTKNGDSALLLTLQRDCSLHVIERVMNYGAEVNHKNKSNQSAAHHVFMYPLGKAHKTPRDVKLELELLLLRGYTQLNEPDKDGNTSLRLALMTKLVNEEVLDIYFKNSANFNAVNNEGDSIIFTAIEYNQSASIVEKLVNCGSDIYKTNTHCQNALHIAAKYGNASVVKMLINKFDLNCLDKDGNTPLHLIRHWYKESSGELYSVLLSNGAIFFAKNKNGQVPLKKWMEYDMFWSHLGRMFFALVRSKHLLVSNNYDASICLTILLKYCMRNLGSWVRNDFDIQHYREFVNLLVDEGGQFILPNEDHLTWSKLKDEHRLRLNDVTLTSTNIEQLKIRMILDQDFPTNATTLSQLLQLNPNIPVSEIYRTLLNDESKSLSECVRLTEIISSPFRL